MSTDAKLSPTDKILRSIGGENKNYKVIINGRTHFPEVRVLENGEVQLMAVEKVGNIQRPYLLANIKDGQWNFGGSGRVFDTSLGTGIGSLLQPVQAIVSNDETTARAILGTATVDNVPISIDDQLKLASEIAQSLYTNNQSNTQRTPGNNPNAFLPSTATNAVIPLETVPFNPNKETEVAPGETNSDAENNDPNATTEDNINETTGDQIKVIAKTAADAIGKFLLDLKLTEADIAQFDKLFENGGGDNIQSAAYPIDNTYGDIRGQDYVTIDQFIYQPPRRDQILGTDISGKRINPVSTITNGQYRLSPLKKFVAQVKLPMPNNITDSNNIAWGDDAMNNLSAALTASVMRNPTAGLIGGAASQLINGPLGVALTLAMTGVDNDGIVGPNGEQLTDLKSRIIAGLKSMDSAGMQTLMKTNTGAATLGMLGVNVSPESLLSRGFGVIPNSNLELLFNNVTLRDFQFSWRMSPRDEKEALQVKRIIRFFKQGMSAKTMKNQAGDRSIYLGTPNIFRLQYRTAGGQIIEGVNRIKPCAVVGTAVNYTPDGQWSAYDKGQPVSCTFSIQMKELEPVYASDYSTNVIGSRRSGELTRRVPDPNFIGPVAGDTPMVDVPPGEGDLYPIRPTEVGY